jgi:hypothetical protein
MLDEAIAERAFKEDGVKGRTGSWQVPVNGREVEISTNNRIEFGGAGN